MGPFADWQQQQQMKNAQQGVKWDTSKWVNSNSKQLGENQGHFWGFSFRGQRFVGCPSQKSDQRSIVQLSPWGVNGTKLATIFAHGAHPWELQMKNRYSSLPHTQKLDLDREMIFHFSLSFSNKIFAIWGGSNLLIFLSVEFGQDWQ